MRSQWTVNHRWHIICPTLDEPSIVGIGYCTVRANQTRINDTRAASAVNHLFLGGIPHVGTFLTDVNILVLFYPH